MTKTTEIPAVSGVGSTDGLEGKLTPEQVENWRNVLLGMVGPYALIMPVEQVQAMRDKFQEQANNLPSNAGIQPSERSEDRLK